MSQKTILVVGDAHCPWIHKKVFARILEIAKTIKPDIVIQVGDLYDFFSASRFPKNPNFITPEKELKLARAQAVWFWESIKSAAPGAACYQLLGNHDARPVKQILEKAPELECFFDIKKLWEFPGVKTIHDPAQELVLNGICFMHGHRSNLGDHAKFNQMPTVVGHSHTGGVVFFPTRGKTIFELNAGYIANPAAVPMRYGPQRLISKWTHGVGIIDRYGPRFVPLK